MSFIDIQKKITIFMLIGVFCLTTLTPVSAGFLPFTSKRIIRPDQYAQREEQINAYNEQAVELFEQGRFKEAQELWEKSIQIMERSDELSKKYPKLEKQQEAPAVEYVQDEEFVRPGDSDVKALYKEAVDLFKKRKYSAANNMFNRVESRVPDYKATRNYQTIITHKMKQAEQTSKGDWIKQNAVSRQAERNEWKRILQESEQDLKGKLAKQVEPLYKDALEQYKSRKFKLAKDYFVEIDSILPHYKDTDKYLNRINEDLRVEQKRILKEKSQKRILARKKEQEEWQDIIAESERKLQEKVRQQAQPIYEEGMYYYKQRQFDLAKSRLIEVSKILPEYKSTEKYLARIDEDIKREEELQEQVRVRETEQKKREEEIVRQRKEKRLAQLREAEEKRRLEEFQREVASRRKEREDWLKVLDDSEKDRKNKIREQAQFVYGEAVQLYKSRQYDQAQDDFLEVERILPGYKSTEKYLAKIDRDIENEERERLAVQQQEYQSQIRAEQSMENERIEEEKRRREIENQKRQNEFQMRALVRKKQREEWEQVLTKNAQERKMRLDQEAKYIYSEALKAYKSNEWGRARDGFLEAQQIIPGYKQSEKYLVRIDTTEKKEEERRKIESAEIIERQNKREMLVRQREEDRQRQLLEKDQRKQTRQQNRQAAAVYKFAESLYKRGEYSKAVEKFNEVEQIFPGYKSAQKYIERIDSDIAKAKDLRKQEERAALKKKSRELQLAQTLEDEKEIRSFQVEEKQRIEELKREASARKKERAEWENTIRAIESENEKRLKLQAEMTYREALKYYDSGWFEQAKEAFGEVEETVPGYKSVSKYLVRIDEKMKNESKVRRKSEQKIKEFLEREEEERRLFAKTKSEMIRADLSPIPGKNGHTVVEKAVARRKMGISRQAEVKYREALSSYKAKDFIEAKLRFIEVESFSPGYKATLDYLKQIDGKIAKQKAHQEERQIALSKKKKRKKVEKVRKSSASEVDDRLAIIDQALTSEERAIHAREKERALRAKFFRKDRQKRKEIASPKQGGWEDQLKSRREELKLQRQKSSREYERQFKQLYKKAVSLYKSGSYVEAKKLFLQIDRMKPGYKKSAYYMKKAHTKIEEGRQKPRNNFVFKSDEMNSRSNIVSDTLDSFEQEM